MTYQMSVRASTTGIARVNVSRRWSNVLEVAPLQRSPWQKHMKTFLYSHIVSSQRSSPSDGPLCRHVRCVAVSNSCSLASEFRVSIIFPHHPEAQGTASTPIPDSRLTCVRLVYLNRSLQLPKSPRERQLKHRFTTLSEKPTSVDANSSNITAVDLLLIVRWRATDDCSSTGRLYTITYAISTLSLRRLPGATGKIPRDVLYSIRVWDRYLAIYCANTHLLLFRLL